MIRAAIFGLGRWGQRLVRSVQDRSDAIRFVTAVTRRLGTILHVEGQFSGSSGLPYQGKNRQAPSEELPEGGMTGSASTW